MYIAELVGSFADIAPKNLAINHNQGNL